MSEKTNSIIPFKDNTIGSIAEIVKCNADPNDKAQVLRWLDNIFMMSVAIYRAFGTKVRPADSRPDPPPRSVNRPSFIGKEDLVVSSENKCTVLFLTVSTDQMESFRQRFPEDTRVDIDGREFYDLILDNYRNHLFHQNEFKNK